MNWMQQAVHVARKDLRMSRWFLVVYMIAVAAAAAIPVTLDDTTDWGIFAPLTVIILGFANVAFVVQADSPYRSDAFWASKPLSRTAVWAGKLLFIGVVVVGLAATGKFFALLLGYGLGSAALIKIITDSIWLYGGLLVTAAFLAALTPDLRSYFLAAMFWFAVLNFISSAIVMTAAPAAASAEFEGGSALLAALITIATILLTAHVYHTRSRKLAIGAAITWAVVSMFIPGRLLSPATAEGGEVPELPAEVSRPVLSVWRDLRINDNESGEFNALAALDGIADTLAYSLRSIRGVLHLPDGTTKQVVSPQNAQTINRAAPPAITGVTWLGYENPSRLKSGVQLNLSEHERTMVLNRTARLEVHGYVDVLKPHITVSLPATAGSSTVVDGQRLKITRADVVDRKVILHASFSRVGKSDDSRSRYVMRQFPEYGLVNRDLGEAVVLNQSGGSGQMLGIVIPGGGGSSGKWELENPPPGFGPGTVSAEKSLLAGGELVHIEWRRIGSVPVSAELTYRAH